MFSAVATAASLPASAARASALSGPPAAKVEEATAPPQPEQQPPPLAAPPVEEAPQQEQGAPPQMPMVQRPEEPIESTVPERPPEAPGAKLDLEYRRGWRYILSGHRENYFITGVSSSQHTVKFQYSVKFDLWPNATRHSVYFGFTQKSLWALWDFDGSSPFLESNYAPEIFYGYYPRRGDIVAAAGRNTWFIDHARAGLEHESNGMDSTSSRSWNRLSGTGRGGVYLGSDHYLTGTLKAWLPPFSTQGNEDISRFVGYATAALEYGYDPAFPQWYGGGNISVAAQKGGGLSRWDYGAVQVTAQWRPGYAGKFVEWWKFTPYLYAQYWEGYGEMLLTYNVRTSAFRVGISFEDRVPWVTVPKRRPSR